MATFVRRNGKIIPKHEAGPDRVPWVTAIQSDIMRPIMHHGTGRIIDSKSAFRRDTKASGCVEIGNDAVMPRTPIRLDRRQRREAIKQSIYNLRNKG